jgi:GNAT superfamily N-acetyltransferase
MAVTPRLRRLLDAVRTLGPGRLAPSLLRWVVLREFVVFTRDLAAEAPSERPDPSLRWTDLSAASVEALRDLDSALDETEIERGQRERQSCRLAWLGRRLVHYRWDTTGPAYLPYLGRWYRPQDGDVLTTWLFTAADQRGRGIQRASHADLRAQALARGCQRSLGIVAVWNEPSLRTNDRTGRCRAGTVGYVAVGPWRRYFATGRVGFDRDGYVVVPPAGEPGETSRTPAGPPSVSLEG